MKSKFILFTLCAAFLGREAHGYNCPSIPKNWDGKLLEHSGPIAWSVGKLKVNESIELKDVTWQAYHAWILTENKEQYKKYGYFQCVYVGYKGEIKKENKVGKLTVASPVDSTMEQLAKKSEFAGGSGGQVENNYNKSGKVGAKCTPTPNIPETLNHFPPACEIVERTK